MHRLRAKVAIVTGGASGLGRAVARRLADEGAHVVITDVQRELGNAVAAEERWAFIEQDVTNESQWLDVIRGVEARFGHVHILVNNAGIVGPQDALSPETTRLADWRRIFAVNVEGTFLGCRAVLPALRRAGSGSIVNISSVAGLLATPYATAYGASKAAVRQLTKSVAQHCAQQRLNVRCNSIHPGNVRTPLLDNAMEQTARARGVSLETVAMEQHAYIPMGDFTLAQDIAAAVAFLASDDARHITGTKLIVDGGITACHTYLISTLLKTRGSAS